MADLFLVLQFLIAIAFALLTIRTVISWLRDTDRPRGFLALAVGSWTLLILIAPLMRGSGLEARTLADVALVLFLLSGFALLMFRDSFVPLSSGTRRATAAIIVVGLFAAAVQLLGDPHQPHGLLLMFALIAVLGTWSLCILEPIVRFWLSARGRPAVQAARLRAVSLGYAGLLAAELIGAFDARLGDAATLISDLLMLAAVPVLYVSVAPPYWLKRLWRQREGDLFRSALHDLLIYSPDTVTLAQRALLWAQRLVGGESAFVIDSDRSILATRGITLLQAKETASQNDFLPATGQGQNPRRKENMLVVPLDLQRGRGAIVIFSGRLMPFFGDDELDRLVAYASSVTAGLDRVALNSRIHNLERAKSDFLNIASHELRGPMTIIKGYLTMLESGALGEVAPAAKVVLPLLISKSDEVTWMLEQMVETSRREEGRLELNTRRRDVVEVTEAAIDGMRILLRDHALKIDEPATPLEADLDIDRFQIVIRNMLTNAAKYSPAGSDITVRIQRQDTTATVAVIDQGVGISDEDQSALFTRFGRIRSTQHVQGTGFGLWLSREIARMHGGDLTCDSTPGVGTTFTLAVPLKQ